MLCSVLLSMCPRNSPSSPTSIKYSSSFPFHQEKQFSPSASLSLSTSMPQSLYSLSSSFSHTMSSISPPGSPPSPTMSMDSIHGNTDPVEMSIDHTTKRIKVMIVDDNSVNLTILSRMLKVHFSETVELAATVTSGVEALAKLSQEEFDLILMDIDMPVLNGVETTIAIREENPEYPILESNRKVPIVAVTTSDSECQRGVYKQVGMSDCVSKPIVISKLRSAIENAV